MPLHQKLVVDERPFIVLPTLATKLQPELKTRASDGAIFLQQLHYWITRGCGVVVDGVRWIYNTYEEWHEQFQWMTEWDFRVVTFKLRDLGLIEFKHLSEDKRDRTGYYRVNYGHEWFNLLSVSLSDASEPVIESRTKTSFPENTKKQQTALLLLFQKMRNPEPHQRSFQLPPSLEEHPANENDSTSQVLDSEALQELQLEGVDARVAKAQIHKYKASIAGAIAYLKWAKQEWNKGVKNPTGVFIDACQKGLVPPTTSAIPANQASPADVDWTQHPDWEKWLHFMRTRGVPTFRSPEGEKEFGIEKRERNAIIKLAEENNLIWVGEYEI